MVAHLLPLRTNRHLVVYFLRLNGYGIAMPDPVNYPKSNTAVMHFLVAIMRLLSWPVMNMRIINTPPPDFDGRAVMVANHRSFIDFATGSIAAIKYKIPMRFLIAYEYAEMPIFGWFIRQAGAIPVYRGDDERRGGALVDAEKALREGYAVVVMPEGSRLSYNDDDVTEMGRLHTGAARLAAQSDVPILIIGLAGTEHAWPRYKWPRFFRREKVVFYIHQTLFHCDPNLAARANTERLRAEMTNAIHLAEEVLRDWKAGKELPYPQG